MRFGLAFLRIMEIHEKTMALWARTGCLVAAFFAADVILADEKVDETLSVDPLGTVSIHNPRGDIEITGWDRDEVRVAGRLDDLAGGLVFRVDGDLTIIRVELPRSNANWGDGSELDIRVPRSTTLRVDGLSSDIDVRGVQGEIAVRSMFYLSPSFDHRVIDGAVAARFTEALKAVLEEPEALLLELS